MAGSTSPFVLYLRQPDVVREQLLGQGVIAADAVVQLQQASLPCPVAAPPVVLHNGSCAPHIYGRVYPHGRDYWSLPHRLNC